MKFKISYPLNLPFPVTQKWNETPEYYNKIGMKGHNGWDFGVPEGTKVYATHDGVVWFSGIDGTMSKTVMIISDTFDYKTGEAQFKTVYAHLSDYLVAPGQKVKKGQQIGLSGNTGRYTMGPHLHFGIHPVRNFADIESGNGYNGCIDPAPYFDGSYPSSIPAKVVNNEIFLEMQRAILAFQVSEGIKDFINKPLKDVNYGEKTKLAANKYK